MQNYSCNVCGYIYDITLGDEEHDINPGINFEELPEHWLCPICGVGKNEFTASH